ncbi:hypothetical protein ACF0H5_014777 [Mactra antiquata]
MPPEQLVKVKSEQQKSKIWSIESLVLALACLVIYVLDHLPVVLIALTIVTLMYTKVFKDVDIRYMFHRLFQHWEDHEHHTENVKAIQNRRKHLEMLRKLQTPVSKTVLSRLSDIIYRRSEKTTARPQAPVFSMNKVVGMNPVMNQNDGMGQPMMTVDPSLHLQAFPHPATRTYNPPGPAYQQTQHIPIQQNYQPTVQVPRQQVPIPQQHMVETPQTSVGSTSQASQQYSHTPVRQANSWLTNSELRRRPLRTYSQAEQQSFSTTGIRNKFMSAFGFSRKPRGLRNQGQNLCFMNCVIQCLSRTPNLLEKLSSSSDDLDCSQAESVMIDSLINLMTECRKTNSRDGVLDPILFREAISVFPNCVVAPPTERQRQQDAAEFCMWLLETLHNALNKKNVKDKRPKGSSVDMLEFIYHDLNADRMESLKSECRKEISSANGLESDTYAEPIQRLADLEWLTHKRKNNSIVDDIFSGQIVEARQCMSGNHLTVNTQTFNILPVPVEASQTFSGIVPLGDCFSKFCNIEHIVQECDTCMKQHGQTTPNCSLHKPSPAIRNMRMSSVDSGFRSTLYSSGYMSPIPNLGTGDSGNDSAFHDNVLRTSTPVNDRTQAFFPSRVLPETERRCLLRQLPETLVIQPLRFSYNQYTKQSVKVRTPISIPLKGLDLTHLIYDHVTNREDLTAGNQKQTYDLFALCCHLGGESTDHGHYVCYCYEMGQWFKYDDELVSEVNIEYELTCKEIRENVYLAFYHKSLPVTT